MSPARSTLTDTERIAARTIVGVEHVAGLGPCWEWDGGHTKDGYVLLVSRPNPPRYVHRIVYAAEHPDESIEGMHVDHRCFNHGCVRGSHLRRLTPGQNNENRQGATRSSSTGARGVYRTRAGTYVVQAKLRGVVHYGGTYPTIDQAAQAASALREQIGMTS